MITIIGIAAAAAAAAANHVEAHQIVGQVKIMVKVIAQIEAKPE